jgi:putative acetyltransferase
MKIRKVETIDIDDVVELWDKTSVFAHNFISESFWMKNKEAMASVHLPGSET